MADSVLGVEAPKRPCYPIKYRVVGRTWVIQVDIEHDTPPERIGPPAALSFRMQEYL